MCEDTSHTRWRKESVLNEFKTAAVVRKPVVINVNKQEPAASKSTDSATADGVKTDGKAAQTDGKRVETGVKSSKVVGAPIRPMPRYKVDGTIETDAQGRELYEWHRRGPTGGWVFVGLGPLEP
jgi:hypothetical protein